MSLRTLRRKQGVIASYWLSVVSLFWQSPFAEAQIPVVQLHSVRPMAVQAGSTVEFEVQGGYADEVNMLHFDDSGINARLVEAAALPFSKQPTPQYGKFQLEISEGVVPGIHEVRAQGRHGISNSRKLWVHSFASAKEPPSLDREQPTMLNDGVVVLGEAVPQAIHYYTLDLEPDQQLHVECVAARLDSRMIPSMRLFDSSLNTVAIQRGDDVRDPELHFRSELGGAYVLAVHDLLYRGGKDFGYALVSVAQDQRKMFQESLSVGSGNLASKDPLPNASRYPLHNASRLPTLDQEVHVVAESEQPVRVALPLELKGKFDSSHDVDEYRFEGQQGEAYSFEVFSERLGEPTDVRMTLFYLENASAEQGGASEAEQPGIKRRQLFQADDLNVGGNAAIRLNSLDPKQLFQLPQSGQYLLEVQDLDTGTQLSATQDYILRIGRPQPGFQLFVYHPFPARDVNTSRPEGLKLIAGGNVSLQVFCERLDGWAGDIELTLEGLPEGVHASPAILAANRNACYMTLSATKDVKQQAFAPTMVGTAVNQPDGKQLRAVAQPLEVTWGRGAGRDFIQARPVQHLMGLVTNEDTAPLAITHQDVIEVKQGESASLPLKLQRSEDSKQNCVVRPVDLPPKVKCSEVTIAADKQEGTLQFSAAKDAPPGNYTMWLQIETKVKWKENPQRLDRAKSYRAGLDQVPDGEVEDPAALTAAKTEADKRVELAKASAAPKDLNLFIPTKHFQIRVVSP